MSQQVMPPVEGGGFDRASEIFGQIVVFDEHAHQQYDARHCQERVTDAEVHCNCSFSESEEAHSACFLQEVMMTKEKDKPIVKCACQKLKEAIRKFYFARDKTNPQDRTKCQCGLNP